MRISVPTLTAVNTRYTWDESKRQANLAKHKLDFLSAGLVLDSP